MTSPVPLRFVVLEHDHPVVHWDFMLERDGVLRSWRLKRPPHSGGQIPADPLPDHRLAYLDYEGPVSGNRGSVVPQDRGTYTVLRDDDATIEVTLAGEHLRGTALLEKSESGAWRFQFVSD